MALFPVPNATDLQDIESIFGFINNGATDGVFFPTMLLVIWAIAFIGAISEGRPASRAAVFSNFISSILAIILALLGFLQPSYMYFVIILLGLSVVWIKLTSSRRGF